MTQEIQTYKNFPTLRAPGQQIPLTEEQAQEYIKCATDPMYFLTHYYTITSLDQGEVIFDPFPYQYNFIDLILNNRFIAILAARQLGKSVVVAGIYLWYVLFKQNQLLGYYSRTADDAKKILSRIKLAYERVPLWLQKGVLEWQKGSILLENKSKIEAGATTANSGRGGSYNIVCLDGDSIVTVRDKSTGEILNIAIEELERRCRRNYSYIYKITNTTNGRYYYGQHTTDNLNDGYMGSGTYMKRAREKYKEDFYKVFHKEIVEFCTFEEKDKREEYYIKKHIKDPLCTNIQESVFVYPRNKTVQRKPFSEEVREKYSKIAKERIGKKNGMYEKGYLLKGTLNGMYGKTHSSDTKRKQSEKKIKYIKEHGSQIFSGKGCIYINNGAGVSKRWDKNKPIPEGWFPGSGKLNRHKCTYHRTMFIYNPTLNIEKLITKDSDIPEGWQRGRRRNH